MVRVHPAVPSGCTARGRIRSPARRSGLTCCDELCRRLEHVGMAAEGAERRLGLGDQALEPAPRALRARARRPGSPCGRRHPCRWLCPPSPGHLRGRGDRRRSGTLRPGQSRSARAPSIGFARPCPRIAPARQPKRRSAPVFMACRPLTSCSPSLGGDASKRPSAARSSICPPTMPPSPAARASAETSLSLTSASECVSGRPACRRRA